MCFGAILLARISRLIYGVSEPKFGFINRISELPGKPEVKSGVLDSKCRSLLGNFFKKLRRYVR